MPDYVSELIGILPKLGVILGGLVLIVIAWAIGMSFEQYVPGSGAAAGGVIGIIFIVIILYICLKYGTDWV